MSADGLLDWLEAVWHDTEGYVYLATKDPSEVWRRTFVSWPAQKDQVPDYIVRQAAQGREVYYSPVIWKEKSLEPSSFKQSWVLWVDFDGNAPSKWPSDGPVTPAGEERPSAAESEPRTGIPEPSARVQSSTERNQHDYWFLEEPITDPIQLQNINKTLALELDSDISVWNVGRVLRPPETVNFGYGKDDRNGKQYPVVIEESSDRRYRVEQFKEAKDFRPLLKSKLGEIPPIQDVLAKRDWNDSFYELFTSDQQAGDGKGRSFAMMKVAYFAAEAGFTPEEIYSVLQDCDDRWGKYKNRTDKEQRFADIIDRAITKHPTALRELNFAGLTGEISGPAGIEVKSIYNLDEFMATEIHLDYIFKGLISAGGYGIIAGQPGLGKTQLSLRMAEATATGTDFLEWTNIGPPRRTMFLSLEMSFPELQEFFKTMDGSFMKSFRENLLIVPVGEMVPLDRPEGRKYVETLIQKARPEVLVIDSLANALTGKLTDDDAVGIFNQYLVKLRQQYGCTIILVHHNRKTQDKRFAPRELDDLYGSRFLSKDAQFVFMLYRAAKDPQGIVSLNPAKLRFAASPGELKLEHMPTLDFKSIGISDADEQLSTGRFSGLFDGGGNKSGSGSD